MSVALLGLLVLLLLVFVLVLILVLVFVLIVLSHREHLLFVPVYGLSVAFGGKKYTKSGQKIVDNAAGRCYNT